jgi:hypothetical protein
VFSLFAEYPSFAVFGSEKFVVFSLDSVKDSICRVLRNFPLGKEFALDSSLKKVASRGEKVTKYYLHSKA